MDMNGYEYEEEEEAPLIMPAWRQAGEDDNWVARNISQLTPLINKELLWLLEYAEERLKNASDIPFALKTAQLLAKYNSVAYCDHNNIAHWNCSRCHKKMEGFEIGRTIYDAGWDLFGYTGYSPRLNGVVVAFRGTDSHSLYNWVENMRYWRTDFQTPYPGSEGALVHTGFFMSYNASALQPNVTDSVTQLLAEHPDADLYVIGHSAGAAMASICALDLKFKMGLARERVHAYTFGSPRVGNDVFARFLKSQVQVSVRVTHNRDIVPSWPPMWVGFHHAATEVWVVDVGVAELLSVCDGSGEDPLCHNSVCYLGLCTSIADHLLYMGSKMYHGLDSKC